MVVGGLHALNVARARLTVAAMTVGVARTLSTAVNAEAGTLSAARRVPIFSRLVAIGRWLHIHMNDELWIAALAMALSIGSYAWYDVHGLTYAFNDARIRELISRRVVVSRTPGLGQLGTTWLPLPSLLTIALIWNDTLFRNGIASSLPSMLGFVIASVYLYKIGYVVTSSRGAGYVAAIAFILNPSLLYMQSTAMSETLSVSALVVAIYYALQMTRTYHATDVVRCAAAVAAGTLIRYENWVVALAILPILVYAAWRHRGYMMAEAWTILYGLLAFAGCIAWVIYNAVIFHDPLLSFFYGQTSHTVYAGASNNDLPARHHPLLAFDMYGYTVGNTVGWLLLVMASLGFVVFIWHARLRLTMLPAYLTLVPFGFYWAVLYLGFNTEVLPQFGQGQAYNIRFGLMMIPAVALFLACLPMAFPRILRRALVATIVVAIALSSISGSIRQTPYLLQEALYGAGAGGRTAGQIDAQWLSSHYKGGNVLITYVNDSSMMYFLLTTYHLPDRALITDANGSLFTRALNDPPAAVTWIVMDSDSSNGDSQIWTTLHSRDDWRQHFTLRKTFDTMQIYEFVGNPQQANGAVGVSR
jgi:Dolichyl-phosphate-mannose-protein mannosyltransferase